MLNTLRKYPRMMLNCTKPPPFIYHTCMAGKGYFPDVESINTTAVPQSVANEFDAISQPYWTWWLASYLLGKGNSSALYVTPVFPKGAKHDQYTYGRPPWWNQRYEAASAIGHALQRVQWLETRAETIDLSHKRQQRIRLKTNGQQQ